ncbi:hypothetical protein [Hyphomicrobium sp. CS1BSMeth3]|uniref:hypothetical protein n=1 Tax=Hyphomicrobium sp. CS1BSMeth3 TaxID=1892844 RepID=UPI0011608A3F|nr:hypothetical protein [Hyphomicrobium sp. CS1BSMeth3]
MAKASVRQPKKTVTEGLLVAVPAIDGVGYVVGLVARAEKSRSLGAAILVYFFPPRLRRVPRLGDVPVLSPNAAISVVRTGVRRIVEGAWPTIGTLQGFQRSDWPIPLFGGVSLGQPGLAWIAEYTDDRIGVGAPRSERVVSAAEAERYPSDSAWGVDAAAHEATERLKAIERSAN